MLLEPAEQLVGGDGQGRALGRAEQYPGGRQRAEAGRRVPEDVSVMGYDDIPEAAHLLPPLTTVRTDFAEIGRRSLHLLVNRIGGTEDSPVDPVVPVELVVRRSTGPAPR